MLITQEIDNLLGGVSQAPPQQRDASQADDLVNALTHPSRGLRKRPPTSHVAKLSSAPLGWESAFIYPVLRSATQRYNLVIVNGDLQVYDAITGTSQLVYFPRGKAYLTTTDLFRAVSTGDVTFILNRSVTAKRDVTKKSPAAVYEALLVIRQADYEMNFTVTLDGLVVKYTTPGAAAANAKTQLGTDVVAANLITALKANVTLNGNYAFTQYGSAVYLARTDAKDFTLTTSDGQAGNALLAIKGAVQSFEKLPAIAKNGMIVEVTGEPESTADNYFVQFSDSHTPGQGGVWKEVIGPGLLTSFDPLTLPHQLVFGGDIFTAQKNGSLPALPALGTSGAGSSWTNGWQDHGTLATSELADQTTTVHNDYFTSVPSGIDGTSRVVTVTCDMDTTALDPTDFITVSVYLETGVGTGVYTLETSGSLQSGETETNAQFQFTAAISAGVRVKVQLTYNSGSTPALGARASITVHGKTNVGGPGILLQKGLGSTITFDPNAAYPAGYPIQFLIGATNFSYTVGATDSTGAAIATALAAIITGGTYTAVLTSPGIILVTQGSGVPPVISAFTSWNSETFWNASLAMTPGAFVGFTLKNLTDGSSGTVTGNTATTISAVLSGGAFDVFHAGDEASVVGTGTYFVFSPAPWEDRAAGDDTTCPFPSLVDNTLDEIFVFQGRLGVTSRENICLSRATDFYNFFRRTATDLLDDDVIDVRSSTKTIPQFFGVIPWLDGAYALTDQTLMRLSGEPVLTPKTVRLDPMGDYPSAANVRPIVADRHLFLVGEKNGFTRAAVASRLPLTISSEGAVEVRDITRHIPTYLAGNPLQVCVDTQAGMLFVLTDGGAQRSVYTCTYVLGGPGEDARQLAWSRWDFPTGGKVIAMDIVNGVVGLVIQRSDGVYLEELTLDPPDVVPFDVLLGDGTGFGNGSYDGTGLPV